MKEYIVLEINGKKDEVLGQIEINTPKEFLLIKNKDSILNNRHFEPFMDELFDFITTELAEEFDKKIDNVYTTFIDDDDTFICSIILSKMNIKKGTYNMQVIDWKANGYTFKYTDEDEVEAMKDKNMKITNKVTDEDYIQWIEGFVTRVLENAYIKYDEVIIDDIEPSRRIFIFIDGKEYTIRTWNYHAIEYDNNNIPCAENVEYTLYEMVEDKNGSHGEVVNDGCIEIEWVN